MILPTRKLLLLLLVPAAVMLLWREPAGMMLGIGLNLGVLCLLGLDLAISPGPRMLDVERMLPPFLSLGAENPVGWDIRNRSRFPVHVELTDDVPEACVRDRDRVAERIPGLAALELRYRVRPTSRGMLEFGGTHVRVATQIGLAVRQARIALRSDVKVYPNVADLARYERALRLHRTAELGLRAVRQRGQGRQFESLREYVAGDDLADVAWKATARRGFMITRNYEVERRQNILVVLDCGRLMTTEVDGLSRLDYAINATLLLTYAAMKQDDSIGLLAFSDRIAAYVPPVHGRSAIGRMNEALYRLEASLAEPNYDQACRFLALRYRKRSLIVILTDVIDRDASSMLLSHAARFARHHLPLCITQRNMEVERIASAAPANADGCYAKVAALQVLERRNEALTRMRRFGVDVLDVAPRDLTPALVNRYLWLKNHRRL